MPRRALTGRLRHVGPAIRLSSLPMPLYEYRCRDCGSRFERFVNGKARVACPECESKRADRLLSVFAVSRGSSSSSSEPTGACGSCGDPRGPGACSID